MTEYRVSKEELIELFWLAYDNGQEKNNCKPVTTIKDFLKSKKPIETLDRGKVTKILHTAAVYMFNLAMGDMEKIADKICALVPQPEPIECEDTYCLFNENGFCGGKEPIKLNIDAGCKHFADRRR